MVLTQVLVLILTQVLALGFKGRILLFLKLAGYLVLVVWEVFTFLESILTPWFSRASPKKTKRTMVVPDRSLCSF